MKTIRNYKCMDEPAKIGGITYFECGALIAGGILGISFFGTLGGLFGSGLGFGVMRAFIVKNQRGFIKRFLYFHLPLMSSSKVLRKCWKRFYI